MTLNLVFLLGWVAEPPREGDTDTVHLTVATRGAGPEEHVLRHRVRAGPRVADTARTLATGQHVYLEGRLTSTTYTDDDGRPQRRGEIVAHTLWPIDAAPPAPTAPEEPAGTHASPRQHTRSGHWRRIAVGRPAERLVWVRATTVGRQDVAEP